jgi:glycerophosphodiester phosphodiesterase
MKEEFPAQESRAGSPERIWGSHKPNDGLLKGNDGGSTPYLRRIRSMSLHESNGRKSDMAERMRHTRAYKRYGFKGNSRGHSIQGPFATLEQTFKALPQHVGFNIELSTGFLIVNFMNLH